MSSTKRKWAKRLVMCCIGFALGNLGANAWDGKWRNACEWGVCAFFAIAWRVEMNLSDRREEDSDYWRGLWLNSGKWDHQSGSADGMGPMIVENAKDKGDM